MDRLEYVDRLEYWVSEICSEAKRFEPNAMIHITKDTIEDEDIDINIYVPKEKKRELREKLAEITSQILMKEGYNILALALDIENMHPFYVYVNAQPPATSQEKKKSSVLVESLKRSIQWEH